MYKKTIPVKSSVAKVFSSSLEAYVVEPVLSPMPIVPPLPQVPVYTIEGSSSFRVKMAMTRTTLASALKGNSSMTTLPHTYVPSPHLTGFF